MSNQDISDLRNTLTGLKVSGKMPAETVVNARMKLLASKAAFASWRAD